jgi:aminoglycoside phosphotransferase
MTPTAYVTAARRRLAGLGHQSRYLAMSQFMQADRNLVLRAALPDGDWRYERALRSVSDVTVYIVRAGHGETCVLKVAATASGANNLRQEHDVLIQLRSDRQLDGWLSLIPIPLAAGNTGAWTYLLTNRLPGKDSRSPALAETGGLTSAAIAAIAPLHRRTEQTHVVDDRLLELLVDEPAERIMTLLPCADVVKRLAGTLHGDLAGREMTLGWTHGDFHPGNIMVSADGRVTGIVDWGEARERDLSALDVAFWLLTMPEHGRRSRGIGGRVADRLNRELPWTPSEERVLADTTVGDLVDGRALLLLAWLRHVASNLAKSAYFAESPLWSRRSVIPVLRQVAHG